MKNVYLFSGLGADHRAFKNLNLSQYRVKHIQWIEPKKNESLELYAERLLPQITTEKPVLIGLSFGGIMAVEVAKHIITEKIILISSIKSRKEIPVQYRITGAIKLYKIIPSDLLKKPNRILFWLFGTKSKDEEILLSEIIKDTDVKFLKWAIERISHWQNVTQHKNLVHIHGTSDKILPVGNIYDATLIKGGGHFMVISKAAQVSNFINEVLATKLTF